MYCIYQIINNINGHKYIGQHKYSNESNPLGKYKGSGVSPHKGKHMSEDAKRKISEYWAKRRGVEVIK